MRLLFAFALLALPIGAQAQTGTVSPGMNRSQVVAAIGEPVTSRTANEFTYLFYRNDCGKSCGMNDLVVLRRDSVVDAIFRAEGRHYTGTSSSPEPINHVSARSRTSRASRPTTAKPAVPATVVKAPIPVVKEPAPAVKSPTPAVAKPVAHAVTKPAVPVAKPSPAAATTPATQLKPSAPNDVHPSVPAGEPPVKKAPATATPAAPTSTRPPAQ